MASAASAPSRSSILARMPSASSRAEKNSNGGTRSARARQRSRVAAGALKRALAAARATSSCHRKPLRLGASARRSSSSRPNSGDLSTLASARSSSGRQRKSPSAIRSCTAICSVSTRRSAPATLMPRALRAEIMAGANGVRLRTNMRMSPARMGRFSDASISAEFEPALGWSGRCVPPAAPPATRRLPRPAVTRARSAWPAPTSRSARSRSAPRGRRDGRHAGSASPKRSRRAYARGRQRCRPPPPAAARRRETTSSAARGANRGPPARRGCANDSPMPANMVGAAPWKL